MFGEWASVRPYPAGPWPVVRTDGTHGLYDPASDVFEVVLPEGDPELSGLADWLPQGELVAWEPGRRADLRLERGGHQLKACVVQPGSIEDLERRLDAAEDIWRSVRGLSLPPIVGVFPDEGVILMGEVHGRPFDQLLQEGSLNRSRAVSTVARALGEAHAAHPADANLGEVSVMTAEDWVTRVGQCFPELWTEFATVLASLPHRRQSARRAPVHGRLAPGSILLGRDVCLIDLDDFHIGDPDAEAGDLVAAIMASTLEVGSPEDAAGDAQRFLDAYGGDRDRIDVAVAHGLFVRACRALFTPGHRERAAGLLRASAGAL
jgi:hypothetical protein